MEKIRKNKRKIHGFDIFNGILMAILSLAFLLPFWIVIAASFSDNTVLMADGMSIWIKGFTLSGYKFLFSSMKNTFLRAFGVSVFTSVATATLTMCVCSLAAFALSRHFLPFRKFFSIFYLIPMFFGGGMIPTFLIVRGIKLYNTIWALILPSVGGMYYIILIKNFIVGIPISLEEACELDGANDFQLFWYVVMPMALPLMMSVWMMTFVGKWNDWSSSLLYLGANHSEYWTIQFVIKQMIADMQTLFGSTSSGSVSDAPLISAKNAGIIISVVPLVIIAPFVQKFYVSGVMAGAVKG